MNAHFSVLLWRSNSLSCSLAAGALRCINYLSSFPPSAVRWRGCRLCHFFLTTRRPTPSLVGDCCCRFLISAKNMR